MQSEVERAVKFLQWQKNKKTKERSLWLSMKMCRWAAGGLAGKGSASRFNWFTSM